MQLQPQPTAGDSRRSRLLVVVVAAAADGVMCAAAAAATTLTALDLTLHPVAVGQVPVGQIALVLGQAHGVLVVLLVGRARGVPVGQMLVLGVDQQIVACGASSSSKVAGVVGQIGLLGQGQGVLVVQVV